VKSIRFRNSVRQGLFDALFTPVGVLFGLWIEKKVGVTANGFSGPLFIVFSIGLINIFSRRLGMKLWPMDAIPNSSTSPPLNAQFLFYLFLDTRNCDALVGDLDERYKLIHNKFGQRRANFWYWIQAIRSVGPIAWAWMKTSLAKPFVAVAGWAIAKGFVAHDSWLAAVVEVWRRIRS
jgi:hypothetical protein